MSPERDLVHDSRVFGRQERLLCEHLEQANHVALTADVWTDWRSHAFLALTVHTNQWVTEITVAGLSSLSRHTGAHIAEEINVILTDFILHSKVRYIVTDDASSMKKALCVLCLQNCSSRWWPAPGVFCTCTAA